MRLLFLSNLLPPASMGGYEAWCLEVAERLRGRGHDVTILTSDYGTKRVAANDPPWVRRELGLEMPLVSLRNGLLFFIGRDRRQAENRRRLERVLHEIRPDAMLIWGMWNLHPGLAVQAEALLEGRVSYYLSDYWPTLPSPYDGYWRAPAQSRVAAVLKGLLRPTAERLLAQESRPQPAFDRTMAPSAFVGEALRRQGIALGSIEVVPGGIDTARYARPLQERAAKNVGPVLLYVGRLTPEKGIETAIEGLRLLHQEYELGATRLIIAGGGSGEYESHLRAVAEGVGSVDFLGRQPEEALPALYHRATMLVFPSIWPEPFARVPLEAMAAGTPVVGTTNGGSGELLRDGHNALTHAAQDASAMAAAIARLWGDPDLSTRLAARALADVRAYHDLDRMVDGIERHLHRLVELLPVEAEHRVR